MRRATAFFQSGIPQMLQKLTTKWRVSFLTPGDRNDIHDMHEGKMLGEAARKALGQL
jgi:hypothetical protein